MSKTKSGKQDSTALLGTYTLPGGQLAIGDLKLRGAKTLLRLHSDEFLRHIEYGACVQGTAYNGTCVSLIDCTSPGTGYTNIKDIPTKYHAEVFPHYVALGRQHINPKDACIAGVHFSTPDLISLFYDFDAFGHIFNAKSIIDVVLAERRTKRPVEAGEWPQVSYFTGKDSLAEVPTAIGKISVNHRPSFSMGGPSGVFIKNRIMISVEPDIPVTFEAAMDLMYEVCCFLSVAAGRAQGIEHIRVFTTNSVDGVPQMLDVHPSYRWMAGGGGDHFKRRMYVKPRRSMMSAVPSPKW